MNAEQLNAVEKSLAQLSEIIKEKVDGFAPKSEVAELNEKFAGLAKDFQESRKQFAKNSGDKVKREVETKLDELAIMKALLTDVNTKQLDVKNWDKVIKVPEYSEAIELCRAFGDVSANNSVTSSEGKEWVGEAFSSTLLHDIWLELEVAQLFGRINMPAATYTLPFNPKRFIARAATGGIGGGSEGGTVTKVKATSDSLQFKAFKLMSIIELTDELDYDALFPVLNELRSMLIEGFAVAEETLCINGDTGTNLYAVALSGEDCRKLALGIRADAAAMGTTVDFGAASGFTADNLRAMRTKLGKYGRRPGDLVYVMDMADYNTCLGFSGYQTLYSYGAGAVILNGELGRLDGIPLIITELLPGAGVATDAADALGGLTAAGKFDGAGAHTKKTCVLVNKQGYRFGDYKEMSLEQWRNPFNGTLNLIANKRLDFKKVGSDTAKFTCVGYNY